MIGAISGKGDIMYKNKDLLLEFLWLKHRLYDEGLAMTSNGSENEGWTANILYFFIRNLDLMPWQEEATHFY